MREQKLGSSPLGDGHESRAIEKAKERISDLDIDALNLGVSFVLMSNSINGIIEKYFDKKLKISQAKFIVLMYLSDETESGLTQAEIARRWNVTDSAIFKLLRNLEKDKFIERKKSEDDGREKIITITSEGQRIFDRALAEYPQWLRETIGELGEGEGEGFISQALRIRSLFIDKT